MLDSATVDAYLERIGAKRPERADAKALAHLHERHVLSVPFENIDFAYGRPSPPIGLGAPALEKIIGRNRGGCCYELNGAFHELLRSLGFDVAPLAARVMEDDGFTPPLGHMALRVLTEDGDGPYLADVGYGNAFRHPLRLAERGEQADPQGTFRLVEADHGDLDLLREGELQYRVEQRPRELADFAAMTWWLRSSEDSPFLARQVCTLPTAEGRVTLAGRTLTRTTGAEKTKEHLADDTALLAAYRTVFGIELASVPPSADAHEHS
ncbi:MULTISPECIES: arylamine N-acetyltransferase family protein [Streptomyces]|uniref:Arylamine N-acetyltransferase n=1 Tax=Streptomyces eurythermus TaxID=42237 RepID=A0ABW6YS34_9ACTN|nr:MULTISPECIES: arylamine N-acetyltransferase [Streptomyces]QIS69276.1 arylamine N-acetyltransferase [Streptomyces sp. DSM 40868]